MAFAKDFLWGAASAAPQIEGAWQADGRCPSIWDVAPAGKIRNDETCHEACDHYHHMREDVEMMTAMGLKSYRFSVSWCRVMPKAGKINPLGLKFYSDLVDALIAAHIEPLVTLYHWDLPVWMQEKGGWMSPEIASYFAQYTRAVVEAVSDRVTWWIPMNEPQGFIMNGHMTGNHAPFQKKFTTLPKLTRNCMIAHKQSVETIRKYAKKPPKIGIAMASGVIVPEDESEETIRTAAKTSFDGNPGVLSNRWFGDPIFKGEPVRAFGIWHSRRKDLPLMQCDLDFIGLNIYAPMQRDWKKPLNDVPEDRKTAMGWLIDGRCMYWTIRFFHERYGLPIMVTENGMAHADTLSTDGHVHDEKRIRYMKEYLLYLKRAVDEGIPVLGYQYWALMDNFEWAEGYEPRFGLAYVDYPTQKRTLKDSAAYYRQVIESNGAIIGE